MIRRDSFGVGRNIAFGDDGRSDVHWCMGVHLSRPQEEFLPETEKRRDAQKRKNDELPVQCFQTHEGRQRGDGRGDGEEQKNERSGENLEN